MTSPTGFVEIDSILRGNGIYAGATNTINYTFNVASSSAASNVVQMDAAQQACVRTALDYVSQVTGVQFSESTVVTSACIAFCYGDAPGDAAARTALLGASRYDIALDDVQYLSRIGDLAPGSEGYELLLHEIGHALGLGHPAGNDYAYNTNTTIMSYTWAGANKTAYSPWDLYALSYLYGGDGVGGVSGVIPDALYPAIEHTVTASRVSILEGSSGTSTLTFTVTRSGSTLATVASHVSWSIGGQASADDFSGAVSGTVDFAAGETSKTISLALNGDTTIEPDEVATVTLANPTGHGAKLGAAISASTTILDDDSPASLSVSASAASVVEGNSGESLVDFVVGRSGNLNTASSANWSIAGDVDADDLASPLSGSVSFAVGESAKTIQVRVKGDTTVENSERIVLTVSPTAGAMGGGTAESVITNDDASNTLTATAVKASVQEGNSGYTDLQFTVARSGDVSSAATVRYGVSSQQATASDFDAAGLPSGTLSFAAGESSKTVTVKVKGDLTPEADETVSLHLYDPTGKGTVIGTADASAVIVNDDSFGVVAISTKTPSLTEGNSGKVAYVFDLDRTGGDLSSAAQINWAVNGGTANAADFGGALPTGVALFAAGQTHTTATVYVTGDITTEVDETFIVQLSGGDVVKASDTAGSVTATIKSDDGPIVFSITPEAGSKLEGTHNTNTTPFNFVVARSGNPNVAASVSWQLVFPTAGADASDFAAGQLTTGSVSFAAGETSKIVSLAVIEDYKQESNENFSVKLYGASGGTISATQGVATETILDDDAPSTFSITPKVTATEYDVLANKMVFTVERLNNSASYSSVKWNLENLTTDASDFTGATSGSLTFLPGGADKQTITVSVVGDDTIEMHEKFNIHISGGGTSDAVGHGLILNDDVAPRTIAPSYNADATMLFDASYYTTKVHDLIPTSTLKVEDAKQNFLAQASGDGWISPSGGFDPDYYANRWADLKALNLDDATLFAHWNKFGIWEGRSASASFDHFDGDRYLTENPDVAAYVDLYINDFLGSRTNGAIAHFVIFGNNEHRLAHDTEGALIEMGYTLG